VRGGDNVAEMVCKMQSKPQWEDEPCRATGEIGAKSKHLDQFEAKKIFAPRKKCMYLGLSPISSMADFMPQEFQMRP
jgi:hypothetical protein